MILLIVITNLNFISLKSTGNSKVLGETTQISSYDFWINFLSKNPRYIPGWIEIGRVDKVNKIDPNYFLK